MAARRTPRLFIAALAGLITVTNVSPTRADDGDERAGKPWTAPAFPATHIGQTDTAIDDLGRAYVLAGEYLARLGTDGRLDTRFGTRGFLRLRSIRDARAMVVNGDRLVILGGGGSNDPTEVVDTSVVIAVDVSGRGTVDESFGTRGLRLLAHGNDAVLAADIALDGNDLVVVGSMIADRGFGTKRTFLTRLTAQGRVDRTLGTDGFAIIDHPEAPRRLIVTDAGYLVSTDVSVDRFTRDGEPDSTFSDDGRFASRRLVTAVAEFPDTRIAVIRRDDKPRTGLSVMSVTVLDAAGAVDRGFDDDGSRSFELDGPFDTASAVARPDGRLLVAASTASERLHVIGLHGDGRLDTSVGRGGWVTTMWRSTPHGGEPIATSFDEDRAALLVVGSKQHDDFGLDPQLEFVELDGRATGRRRTATVAAAALGSGATVLLRSERSGAFGPSTFSVQRLLPDGGADTTFADAGVASFRSERGLTTPVAVASQRSRTIVGFTEIGVALRTSEILALGPDGRPDTSFGVDGRVVVPSEDSLELRAVLVDRQRRVLTLSVERGASARQIVVHRFTPSGALDIGFGSGGRVEVPRDRGTTSGDQLLEHGDGYVFVATGPTPRRMRLVRLAGDGSIDLGFTSTPLSPSLSRYGNLRHLAVEGSTDPAGGRIAVVIDGFSRSTLSLLGPDGRPLNSFGTGGRIALPLRLDAFDVTFRPGRGLVVHTARSMRQRIVVTRSSFLASGDPDGEPTVERIDRTDPIVQFLRTPGRPLRVLVDCRDCNPLVSVGT